MYTISILPLYIDPGTGSMIFSLFIGIATTAVFGIRALVIKLKFLAGRGKKDKQDKNHLGIVIYTDSKRYWNVFKPIAEEFEARKIPLTYYTQSEDDPAFKSNFEFVKPVFIGEGNRGFAKMNFLNADICLSTTPGLDVLQWKRSNLCKEYIHIPHSVSDLAGYRMFGLDHYDAILASGKQQESSIRKLEKIRPTMARKDFIEVGSTYLDSMKKRLDSLPAKEPNAKKVVLVAPTWGKSGILSKFGEKFLASLAKTDYKIIIRPHPQSVVSEQNILKPLQEKFSQFEWNYDNDNFDVLNKADIMITDFSGVIFDFTLVFDKPVIYADTTFDKSPYDIAWLDEPLWEFTILSKIGIKLKESQFDDMQKIIAETIENKALAEGRNEVRELAWAERGNSAKVTVDFLVKEENAIKNEDIAV